MRLRLKPLSEQVLVVTGASSGIGRATTRLAGAAGARVVLAARDRAALDDAAHEVEAAGGRAAVVRCDVADLDDVERLARRAVRAFDSVDTWVNNAGTSVYGRLTEIPLGDLRRLMEVNFWGVVYGSRVAVQLLAREGGALVNVGSVLSDRAIPLQGMYCATKHAVKGFTDALRMELEEAGLPVSVSLVKPATMDTPFYDTARSYMDAAPRPVPPVYAPEVAARAILACAVRPIRDLYAGGAAKAIAAAGERAPRLTDRAMERTMFRAQRADAPQPDAPPHDRRGNLDAPRDERAERGRYDGHVSAHSAYTTVSAAPRAARFAALAAGVGIAAALTLRGRPGGGA